MKRARKSTFVALCTAAAMGVSGCGAPVLSSMTPQVWKPTGEVILVDNPPGWKALDVQQVGSAASVALDVVPLSSVDLLTRLNHDLATASAGLYVLVLDSTPPSNLWALIQSHPSVHFEVIGVVGSSPVLTNLRVVQTDLGTEAYLLGWATGQLALLQGQTQLGWDQGTTPSISKSQVQAFLAGIYAANPSLAVVPLQLGPIQSNQGLGFPLPRLVFSPGALSAATEASLAANGAELVSMSPSSAAVLQPQLVPPETTLPPDLQAFEQRAWKAGLVTVDSPKVTMQSGRVPAALPGLVDGMAPLLTKSTVAAAWQQVPAARQTQWAPIVNSGS